MNIETTIEQLQPYLVDIAQGIGQASGWTWEIFVRQQYVDGFIALFFLVLSLALVGLVVWLIKKGSELKANRTSRYDDDFVLFYIIAGVLGAIVFAGIITSSVIAIQKFANPEYQALTDIISTVRGGE